MYSMSFGKPKQNLVAQLLVLFWYNFMVSTLYKNSVEVYHFNNESEVEHMKITVMLHHHASIMSI